MFFTGISAASVYRCIWKCIDGINACEQMGMKFPQTANEACEAALGFKSISRNGCIKNCVSVIDGYHLQIQTPSKKEVKNVRSFFSGHYQTYGVNVQAACNHHCQFTFIGVAGPGVMGDRDAVKMCSLSKMIENLPGLYCVIGDCAYNSTEHLVPIYRGEAAKMSTQMDNFNFYASQLCIRIEMAFGLMINKWGILLRPLKTKVRKIKKIIVAIARLHNFCISFRLAKQRQCGNHSQSTFSLESSTSLSPYDIALRETAASQEFEDMVATLRARAWLVQKS
jgi:DDE superfamily endonuclease